MEKFKVQGFEPTTLYAEKVAAKIVKDNENDTYVETGLISGSKLGDASLNIILKMLGIGQEFDAYTLGKFRRGHDLEAVLVELLTGIPHSEQVASEWLDPRAGAVIQGKVMFQGSALKPYRGMSNSIDMIEDVGAGYIIHEFKSATKMAYDQVAATGNAKYKWEYNYALKKRVKGALNKPSAREHHAIQVSSYALGAYKKPVLKTYIHYINADDYRMISFEVDPSKYKEEIDREIDEVQFAFNTKILPEFKPLFAWQKGKYNSFADWEKLKEIELMAKLRAEYPEAHQKFMSTTLTDNGIE